MQSISEPIKPTQTTPTNFTVSKLTTALSFSGSRAANAKQTIQILKDRRPTQSTWASYKLWSKVHLQASRDSQLDGLSQDPKKIVTKSHRRRARNKLRFGFVEATPGLAVARQRVQLRLHSKGISPKRAFVTNISDNVKPTIHVFSNQYEKSASLTAPARLASRRASYFARNGKRQRREGLIRTV